MLLSLRPINSAVLLNGGMQGMLNPASSIQSAPLASILLAEAVGNLAVYSLGVVAGGVSRMHSTSSDANKNNDFSWLEVSKKNKMRIKQRSLDKAFTLMFVFCLSLILQGVSKPADATTSLFPSFGLMVLFKVYVGLSGITDELEDLPEGLKTKQSKLACYTSTAASATAIPVLMCALPSLYIPYAINSLGSFTLAGKIDNKHFQFIGFLGIFSLFAVTFAMNLPLKSFPLIGLFTMLTAESLWQIHDEHPGLIALTKKIPSLNKVWRILNKNTFMLVLTVFGLLPLPWLATSTPAYAVAKVGLAKGVLLNEQENTRT